MQPAAETSAGPRVVGQGGMRYAADPRWGAIGADPALVEVAGVAADSQGRIYVFNRGQRPVLVFAADGTPLAAWGEGCFRRPHGVTVGPDDSVWCADDSGHAVGKFTPDGRRLLTLGTGDPSETGAAGHDYTTIRRAAGPFNYPTNLAVGPGGDLYVADGYGNARVHHFAADGRLLASWGEPGDGPGQFRVPHGIAVDAQGTVYVADRENSRVQLFAADGRFVAQWTDVARPCQVFAAGDGLLYVAELGFRAGLWPWMQADPQRTGGRVSVFTPRGELAARWGGGDDPCAAGDFFAPHGICVDARGDVYVAEVTRSAGGNRGLVPADCHCVQKFARS